MHLGVFEEILINTMLRTVIIDDEYHIRDTLIKMLTSLSCEVGNQFHITAKQLSTFSQQVMTDPGYRHGRPCIILPHQAARQLLSAGYRGRRSLRFGRRIHSHQE